ncbi:hypothetical protein SCLARK_001835 [Spiroplasma clarkii]|uniref:hypothetical protein n=1 Tax=Spiroplasma clarkii TaxID=2139 RepID=UPI000B55BE61|nr:hypothetical protein [Spiroplasma clarkii]ARU92278.1 hypothetical protein SCLARK_001835 [Spiroplasma clarkii]
MFKSSIIEYKQDYAHYIENYEDGKYELVADMLFKINNAKFVISNAHFEHEITKIQGEIKTTKQIFKEEVRNEITKYAKIISELKAENKELKEKGFNKYYNSGLYGISKYFKNLNRDHTIVILNQAVIAESEANLKIVALKKQLKQKMLQLLLKNLKHKQKPLRMD